MSNRKIPRTTLQSLILPEVEDHLESRNLQEPSLSVLSSEKKAINKMQHFLLLKRSLRSIQWTILSCIANLLTVYYIYTVLPAHLSCASQVYHFLSIGYTVLRCVTLHKPKFSGIMYYIILNVQYVCYSRL
jgi:hypothetical protein